MNIYLALVIGSILAFLSFAASAYGKGRHGGYWVVCNAYNECRRIYRGEKWYSPYYQQMRERNFRKKQKAIKRPPVHRKPLPERISTGNIINVDLTNLSWGAYDYSGKLIKSGRASGGQDYCPDIGKGCKTVTGTYTIFTKKGADCKSKIFPVKKGGAPMPYCMFFKDGFALHGSNSVPDYNASHGCVRMSPKDAQWLNQNFVSVGTTRVKVNY